MDQGVSENVVVKQCLSSIFGVDIHPARHKMNERPCCESFEWKQVVSLHKSNLQKGDGSFVGD